MSFVLGSKSHRELEGVHPDLVRVVKRAIEITTQDFTVFDGIRTLAAQKVLKAKGASQTLNSKHLPQPDGHGHAVDLVPWINGGPRWEWGAIYPIAEAMRAAGNELGVKLRWGGNWAMLTGTTAKPEALVKAYVDMRRSQGRKAFIDGPHYEWAGQTTPVAPGVPEEPVAIEKRMDALEARVAALEVEMQDRQ